MSHPIKPNFKFIPLLQNQWNGTSLHLGCIQCLAVHNSIDLCINANWEMDGMKVFPKGEGECISGWRRKQTHALLYHYFSTPLEIIVNWWEFLIKLSVRVWETRWRLEDLNDIMRLGDTPMYNVKKQDWSDILRLSRKKTEPISSDG